MVVVKIELWPGGLRAKKREIGRIVIANDGTGDAESGNYIAALAHAGTYSHRPGAWKAAPVIKQDRTRSPYHLVAAAIAACLRGGWPKKADSALIDMTRDGSKTPGEQQVDRLIAAATAKAGG